jgi:hypothetical protein
MSELANMLVGMEWFWFIFGRLLGALAVLWLDEWVLKPRIDCSYRPDEELTALVY